MGSHPKSILFSCATLAIVFAAAQPAAAWGPLGHRAVARVAEHFLNDRASNQTHALLGTTMTLEDAATWPDQIRKDPQYAWVLPLHYVHVAEGAAHFDMARDCGGTTGCVVSAIIGEMDTLRLTTTTTESKQLALKLLVHFVGDIHMPLHAGRAADDDGSLIKVTYDNTTTTLHWLWDQVILEHHYKTDEQLANDLLGAVTPAMREQWFSLDPAAWAEASYQYALSNAYPIPADGVIDLPYEQKNLPVMRMRLAQAGVRLAAVLNSIWPEPKLSSALPRRLNVMPVAAGGLRRAAR